MSMIAEQASETGRPWAAHRSWCDPSTCDVAEGGVHWGESAKHRPSPSSKTREIAERDCEVQLSLAEEDAVPLVWFEAPGSGTMSIGELAALGAWLTARAAAFDRLVAEDGAR